MKLYGHEVNRFNYRNYSTIQLNGFRIALADNIRTLQEKSHSKNEGDQLNVFDLQELNRMRELVVLIIREINVRSPRNS